MYRYVLPLMLSVMTARFVGNVFNEAIQDMQITVKKLPFLEVSSVCILASFVVSLSQSPHYFTISKTHSTSSSRLLSSFPTPPFFAIPY